MIFFNDTKLAVRFRENMVPSRERLFYYIVFILAYTVLTTSVVTQQLASSRGSFDDITDIISIVGVVIGTLWCYRSNALGDNKEFIERIICLSFPVMIRTIVLSILILAAFYLGDFLREEFLEQNKFMTDYQIEFASLLIMIAIMVYFYIRLSGSIRIAASRL